MNPGNEKMQLDLVDTESQNSSNVYSMNFEELTKLINRAIRIGHADDLMGLLDMAERQLCASKTLTERHFETSYAKTNEQLDTMGRNIERIETLEEVVITLKRTIQKIRMNTQRRQINTTIAENLLTTQVARCEEAIKRLNHAAGIAKESAEKSKESLPIDTTIGLLVDLEQRLNNMTSQINANRIVYQSVPQLGTTSVGGPAVLSSVVSYTTDTLGKISSNFVAASSGVCANISNNVKIATSGLATLLGTMIVKQISKQALSVEGNSLRTAQLAPYVDNLMIEYPELAENIMIDSTRSEPELNQQLVALSHLSDIVSNSTENINEEQNIPSQMSQLADDENLYNTSITGKRTAESEPIDASSAKKPTLQSDIDETKENAMNIIRKMQNIIASESTESPSQNSSEYTDMINELNIPEHIANINNEDTASKETPRESLGGKKTQKRRKNHKKHHNTKRAKKRYTRKLHKNHKRRHTKKQ